jgi:hypothetical protein
MLSSSRFSASGDDLLAGLRRLDLEHLAGHRLLEAVDAGDAVLHLEDGTDFFDVEGVARSAASISRRRMSLISPGRRPSGKPYRS